MVYQTSIKESTPPLVGVNIYNNRRNHVIFHPAEENSGLVFIVEGEKIPASLGHAQHRKYGIYLLVGSKEAEHYANPEEFGVRYNGKEFVRHKVLDVIGTLALFGRQFKATEFKFQMTGHEFDIAALKRLDRLSYFADYESSHRRLKI